MGMPRLDCLEGHRHVENRPSLLQRDDPARSETAPITGAVHLKADGLAGVASPQKIGMQGVGGSVFRDGVVGGTQALAQDLSTKDGTPSEVLALGIEGVVSQGGKVEDVEESLEGLLHDRQSALGGGVGRGGAIRSCPPTFTALVWPRSRDGGPPANNRESPSSDGL